MSRKKRTVAYLADIAYLSSETALKFLAEKAGLKFKTDKAVIPKNRIREAQVALGISPVDILSKKDKDSKEIEKPDEKALLPKVTIKTKLKNRALKSKVKLPIIGHVRDMEYLNWDTVEKIHYVLVVDFQRSRDPISPPGVKSKNLLYSAMTRFKTSLGNDLKYPTLELASAALMHSLIHNHPFHNGNKRTALVSMLVFLDMNGYCIKCSQEDAFDFIMKIGERKFDTSVFGETVMRDDAEVWAIARWIRSRIYQKMVPSRVLKFHQLFEILKQYDCVVSPSNQGGFIDITRGSAKVRYSYGGEGREVDANLIRKIRKDLELDEEHGYDPALFYNAEQRLPEFINHYRKTLDLLARQ